MPYRICSNTRTHTRTQIPSDRWVYCVRCHHCHYQHNKIFQLFFLLLLFLFLSLHFPCSSNGSMRHAKRIRVLFKKMVIFPGAVSMSLHAKTTATQPTHSIYMLICGNSSYDHTQQSENRPKESKRDRTTNLCVRYKDIAHTHTHKRPDTLKYRFVSVASARQVHWIDSNQFVLPIFWFFLLSGPFSRFSFNFGVCFLCWLSDSSRTHLILWLPIHATHNFLMCLLQAMRGLCVTVATVALLSNSTM